MVRDENSVHQQNTPLCTGLYNSLNLYRSMTLYMSVQILYSVQTCIDLQVCTLSHNNQMITGLSNIFKFKYCYTFANQHYYTAFCPSMLHFLIHQHYYSILLPHQPYYSAFLLINTTYPTLLLHIVTYYSAFC